MSGSMSVGGEKEISIVSGSQPMPPRAQPIVHYYKLYSDARMNSASAPNIVSYTTRSPEAVPAVTETRIDVHESA